MLPRYHQIGAAKTAAKIGRGTVSMVTGYGKSLTMALLINELQVKTLIVVPSLSLKEQLKATMLGIFGSLDNIIVENIDSNALKEPSDCDMLILDEVHHSASKTYHRLNRTVWKDIYYRFGFTATPYRNQDNEQLLFKAIAGDVIYKVGYKEAVKDEAIVPIEAYYIDVPKQETEAFIYAEVYKQLVTGNLLRNSIIASLLISLKDNNKSTLCLVKEISHGNAISSIADVPFTNGQDEASRDYIRQFNSGSIVAVIGTTGIMGEGVDTKPCEFVIIAGLGKAKSAFMQQIGRGVRVYPGKESCKVILFRDTSHKFTLRHYKQQCKILKEEFGVVPTKLEVA